MNYVTLSLAQEPAVRHPMHEFVVEHEGYERTRLLGSTVTGDTHTALFHVDGWPPEAYEEQLASVETVQEHALSTEPDRTFTVYVRETLGEHERALANAFDRTGLVTLFPIVYRDDGTVVLTLVGPPGMLQRALETTPDGISIDVRDLGNYEARRVDGGRQLTDRQTEAVAAAVERGYYDDPREASVADVAAVLDCAPGTAAEHLRRAERTVMAAHVGERP